MSCFVDELQDVLEQSLKALEDERYSYAIIKIELKKLLAQVQEPSSTQANRLVCIGCDLWVEMAPSDAAAHFHKRIEINSIRLRQISEKIDRSRLLLDNFHVLPEPAKPSQVGSNSSSIVDIQEVLDENCSIVSVTLNDKMVEVNCPDPEQNEIPKRRRSSNEQSSNGSPSSKKGSELLSCKERNENQEAQLSECVDYEDQYQINELLADMEIVSGKDRPAIVKNSITMKSGTANDKLANKEEDFPPSIRPEDIYELELIVSEQFSEREEEYIEEEELNSEIEDSEDDESNGEADELLYSGYVGMFTGQSTIQARLWDEVQALRAKNMEIAEETAMSRKNRKPPSLKLVRFSENTEVKEIEDVSKRLKKIEHKKQKPLRFRQRLIMSGKAYTRPKRTIGTGDDSKESVSNDVTNGIINRSGL